jgi:hypothetical protein
MLALSDVCISPGSKYMYKKNMKIMAIHSQFLASLISFVSPSKYRDKKREPKKMHIVKKRARSERT